ncbi:MAG: sigma-E factor negative regulatory protein [Gammaproteobacteria bacterium]|nr:sigma-E factor negative regulatory protein [Gammaproteobacteria bacterium]
MTESTRESLHEALSAAVDGEAEELELRRVLNAIERDPELRAKWERLHLIGDVMRGETTRLDHRSMAGLDEPTTTGGEQAAVAGRSGGRWATGLAAAAAVMIAVTFVALQDREPLEQPVVAKAPSEEDLRRAHDYFMAHHNSVVGRSPTMTYVKVLTVPDGSVEGQ